MKLIQKHIISMILCALMAVSAGCGGRASNVYIREDVDFSYIQKVAVLPLDNLTSDKNAGEIVRQLVISELLSSGYIDVTMPGESRYAMDTLGIRSVSKLNEENIKALGKALKVQAVVTGAVEEYKITKTGTTSNPEVSITLLMADTASGTIIWSVSKTGGGSSFMARHFGTKSKTMSEAVLEVVRDAIGTFTEY